MNFNAVWNNPVFHDFFFVGFSFAFIQFIRLAANNASNPTSKIAIVAMQTSTHYPPTVSETGFEPRSQSYNF
jgi:hypothetical protein